jgi:hypothetical protein
MYKRRKEGGRVSRGGEKVCKMRGRRKYEANEEDKEGTSKKRRGMKRMRKKWRIRRRKRRNLRHRPPE